MFSRRPNERVARLQASLALEDYGAMLDEHIIMAPPAAEGGAQPLEPDAQGAPRAGAGAGRPPTHSAPRSGEGARLPDADASLARGEAREAALEAPPTRGDIRDTPEYRAAVELEIWKEHQKAIFEKEACKCQIFYPYIFFRLCT